MARAGGGRRGTTDGRGGRGKRRPAGGARRWLAALGVLALLAASAAASAAWLGLVPGVQLRDRRSTDSESVVADEDGAPSVAADAPSPEALADSLAVPEWAVDTAAAALDVEALLVPAADSAAGDALWRGAGRCAGCHGAAGEGVERLGPDLRDTVWLHGGTRAAIRTVIERGAAPPRGGYSVRMPGYAGQLDDAQLARLTAFVWTLSRPGAVSPDSAAPPADAAPVPRPTVPLAP